MTTDEMRALLIGFVDKRMSELRTVALDPELGNPEFDGLLQAKKELDTAILALINLNDVTQTCHILEKNA